ncbi:vacuolar sorting-associated protein [Rutstroemia sp. NJR-2017a WRK4]|nr:vacuolar sorting-associated protein [Rutstroemia sp. NJR-2017a WRK4]
MFPLRRIPLAILLACVVWFAATSLHKYLDPNTHISDEEREDARWIATSKHFLDRQACRWLGLCGLAHYHADPAWRKRLQARDQVVMADDAVNAEWVEWDDAYKNREKMRPDDWFEDERVLREVPQYVLDHTPLVHLYSGEKFWPADIEEHLKHVTPYENHTSLHNVSQHNLNNLHLLNELGRRSGNIFLQSKEDVEARPTWLGSAYNKPIPYEGEAEPEEESWEDATKEFIETKEDGQEDWDDAIEVSGSKVAAPIEPTTFKAQPLITGQRRRQPKKKRGNTSGRPSQSGYSPAPATLIIVDKGHGIVDAFWFYFYSYNLGTTVMKMRFGNHIGDWEHSLIRFHHGVPKAVFFSAHFGGLGYHYKAVEKSPSGRPVIYSAVGSHAMYATPGTHPYVLPFGILADVTDKGPIWDPALNYRAYFFNTSLTHDVDARMSATNFPVTVMADTFAPAAQNPDAPTSWFWFNGHWGDKFYELSDWRQWRFVGQYHYVNGPVGPRFKNLGRSRVCQSGTRCVLVDSLEKGKKRSWVGRR